MEKCSGVAFYFLGLFGQIFGGWKMVREVKLRRWLKSVVGEVEWQEAGRGGTPGAPDAWVVVGGERRGIELKRFAGSWPGPIRWKLRPVQARWHRVFGSTVGSGFLIIGEDRGGKGVVLALSGAEAVSMALGGPAAAYVTIWTGGQSFGLAKENLLREMERWKR